ncbi:MAG: extracellular solute-binding protein [Chloroflexota bacterium]|nr:extracellular solute-binding protein [Chloroflexota bacterium]
MADGATPHTILRAVFLPATWGIQTKEIFAPEFERQTGIRVEIDLIGRDAIYDWMCTRFAARDASYDLFNMDYNWVPEFAQAGHLQPLDDAFGSDSDFLPKAIEVARYNATLFALPQTVHPHLLWYRRDLFDAAELRPPQTMDDWLHAVRRFHGKEIDGVSISGWAGQAVRGYGNVHTWLTFLYSFGGDAFSDHTTLEPRLNTPEAIAATEFWAEMMRYTPPGIDDYTYDDVINAAAAGMVATCMHGSWGTFAVDDPHRSATIGKWDFVNVPRGVASVSHLTEWLTAVSSYSQQPDAAIAFLRYLESSDCDIRQALYGAGDPVRTSSYTDPRLTEARVEGYPNLRRFRRHAQVLQAMQTAKPRPLFAKEEQWETVVSAALWSIQTRQSSVRRALAKAQEDVAQMIKEMRSSLRSSRAIGTGYVPR